MISTQANKNKDMEWSDIEKKFLGTSADASSWRYEEEKIPTIEVTNIYELGKLVSQRFMEWVHQNPTGVVALPTGRTPEFFIKTLEKYKSQWESAEVQEDLAGTNLVSFPKTDKLRFVMLDEFFPMPSSHRNSFCRYIQNYYVNLLDIQPENVLTFDLVSQGIITNEEMQLFDGPLVDIDLLNREPVTDLETQQKNILLKVANYCEIYEERIRDWGGIGFFLGGIGPDGHIAFNQKDAPLDSLTRIVNFNYPSAAQSAGDLGGIENARGKAALTIGLKTITANPSAVIIIMVAGEGKASIVREALEEDKSPAHPASCLHGHAGGRFYITQGAACHLTNRKFKKLLDCSQTEALEWALSHLSGCTYPGGSSPALKAHPPSSYRLLETYLYDQSMKLQIPVHQLTPSDLSSCPPSLTDELACRIIVSCASKRLKEKIESGIVSTQLCQGKSIVHTAPHHDDIMLSYHAAMHDHLGRPAYSPNPVPRTTPSYPIPDVERSPEINALAPLGEQINGNVNHFAYLTSGFHSVNEEFLAQQCEAVLQTVEGTIKQYFYHLSDRELLFIDICVYVGDITKNYDEIMTSFRHAFYQQTVPQLDHIEHVIFLRKVCEVWNIPTTLPLIELAKVIKERVLWVRDEYLPNHSPGDSIPREIQLLKGCMRETEVDRVWALSRMPMSRIHHLRSKFYTDDFFTPMPNIEDDAVPMANLIKSRQPNILTVALDPEGTGPDTHYKVLLVVAAGLRLVMSHSDLQTDCIVWGYRNVWFEFTPSDATLMIPVTMEDLDLMHDTFMTCFTTQKKASFPSPYYDGPFSLWSKHIQIKQKNLLSTLLGEEYFQTHDNSRVRNSSGFVFIKAMHAKEFLSEVEQLKSTLEKK